MTDLEEDMKMEGLPGTLSPTSGGVREPDLQRERDYAWGEMKNAQAYWRAETAHAEQAEAMVTELVAALADLLTYHATPGPVDSALTPLLDRGYAVLAKATGQ